MEQWSGGCIILASISSKGRKLKEVGGLERFEMTIHSVTLTVYTLEEFVTLKPFSPNVLTLKE